MFKHIPNFKHKLKPYWCQQDKSMSPDAFLNEGFISANFVIINAFPKVGKFPVGGFLGLYWAHTTKLHKATNLYVLLNGSDS